jgi:hypothetical protein
LRGQARVPDDPSTVGSESLHSTELATWIRSEELLTD